MIDRNELISDLDLDVDIGGVLMPWWLVSMPDQVTTVHHSLPDGTEFVCTFEAFVFATATTKVHCTYPRYSSCFSRPDPLHECRWTHPTWDEQAMIEHVKIHIDDALGYC